MLVLWWRRGQIDTENPALIAGNDGEDKVLEVIQWFASERDR